VPALLYEGLKDASPIEEPLSVPVLAKLPITEPDCIPNPLLTPTDPFK
jgi:hypothetical protein